MPADKAKASFSRCHHATARDEVWRVLPRHQILRRATPLKVLTVHRFRTDPGEFLESVSTRVPSVYSPQQNPKTAVELSFLPV
jgi:hypothetical protein